MRVPMTLSPVFIVCCNSSQDSGKHLTYIYQFIRKDLTQEQPKEETQRARYAERGADLTHPLGVHLLPSTSVRSPAQKLIQAPSRGLFKCQPLVLITWAVW